jgi:hypothetical protein
MKRYPVVSFYILAFAFSWLGWLPMVASSWGIGLFAYPLFQILLLLPAIGPALAASLVTAVNDGKAGLDRLFRPLKKMGRPFHLADHCDRCPSAVPPECETPFPDIWSVERSRIFSH